MRPAAVSFEVPLVAASLMIVMLVVMWAQRPIASCTLSFEAPRQLVLDRQADREHLATDVASADRIARRYRLATLDSAQPPTQVADCEATLVQQIATRHGLTVDAVRASPPNNP